MHKIAKLRAQIPTNVTHEGKWEAVRKHWLEHDRSVPGYCPRISSKHIIERYQKHSKPHGNSIAPIWVTSYHGAIQYHQILPQGMPYAIQKGATKPLLLSKIEWAQVTVRSMSIEKPSSTISSSNLDATHRPKLQPLSEQLKDWVWTLNMF